MTVTLSPFLPSLPSRSNYLSAEDKSARSITSIRYALQAKLETHTQTELFITLLTLFQFSFSILKKKDISYCISFKEEQENSIYDYQRII